MPFSMLGSILHSLTTAVVSVLLVSQHALETLQDLPIGSLNENDRSVN